ncbi:uncharacterized protein M421DRAFT_270601 [Didymella exigua CBS 183.55]|uniref:Uncharacterized protein n=1 Tax=Didymella exigua CBS 183.55 TaxID=1150837 RepID=A0A6A5RB67_9PLEO|nr:uncharacterized protein M421DRAFT_270601 [Didymella exigua CBS 183.55]KAF1924773.1 hypothetical protein M421DRAFT_270601 [Didymella exigua CBS 183.55]
MRDVKKQTATSTRLHVGPFRKFGVCASRRAARSDLLTRGSGPARRENVKQARDGASPAESHRNLQAFPGPLFGSPTPSVCRPRLADARSPASNRIKAAPKG